MLNPISLTLRTALIYHIVFTLGTLVQLTGAAWPGCASLCLQAAVHAVTVRPAALVSDEKQILEACTRRCAIQIKTFTFYLTFTRDSRYCIAVVRFWAARHVISKANCIEIT